jgi:hypothetical protein
MQITDILAQTGGLQSMARELGVSENQAASGAEALIPAILGGFKKQAQSQPSGAEGLGDLLGQLGGGGLMDDVLSPQPTPVDRGNDVLGQIFGSKDVSRTVAQNAASHSGLDPSVICSAVCWVGRRAELAGQCQVPGADSARCSTLTATATRSTTS